ncbi:MAG: hypothetical protein GKS02_01930 [Alphaproteobacteria bacterium]|nr:hypothetical protein [Alphaproteobacteria bacterium]
MAATVVGLAATPAAAGSIGPSEVGPTLAWESSCKRPVQPNLYLDDLESYYQALDQFNTHVAQVRRYIQCVQAEGKTDIDALAAAVASGMQNNQNAAIKDAEELRTDLEVQRSLLQ